MQRAVELARRDLDLGAPLVFVDRDMLPAYQFDRCQMIIAIGPDGLIANTAKYAGDIPLIGVNPDPARNDGQLLPFAIHELRDTALAVMQGQSRSQSVTLGEVELNDGQRMLAFNDFFIGTSGHSSARYTLSVDAGAEAQSSSGIVVSTGAGSTGWLSSMLNMANGLNRWFGQPDRAQLQMDRESPNLFWMVREPFASRHSQANLVAGMLKGRQELRLESLMPEKGIIFSDGLEADALEFTTGSIARIRVSRQQARLVQR